jgi:hypothetical protein
MAERDVASLALLIKYSEEEAVRLALPPIIIHCLRMANEELSKTVAPTAATDDVHTKH